MGCGQEMAGFAASERGFSEADLTRALDPRSNVALRANTGGPAPAETERMIRDRLVCGSGREKSGWPKEGGERRECWRSWGRRDS